MGKDTAGPHDSHIDSAKQPGKDHEGAAKAQKGPGKQNPNPGDQGPHGGGEGVTGMQPGAGHPRGR
jgi:hypothetical protein